MELIEGSFDDTGISEIDGVKKLSYWPVVYLLHDGNKTKIYVGETCNISDRLRQHYHNDEKRNNFQEYAVLLDPSMNKSVILDYEQFLIRLYGADKWLVDNKNAGQSPSHDYYKRSEYRKKIENIWKKLASHSLVNEEDYFKLINSDFFKYSPYSSLNPEQEQIKEKVIRDIYRCKEGSFVISGSAGTGKTILALNLLLSLKKGVRYNDEYNIDIGSINSDPYITEDELLNPLDNKSSNGLKVGLVVPMQSLRGTLKKVVKSDILLRESDIIGPNEIIGRVKDKETGKSNYHFDKKDMYDVLIVDEAHRLSRRHNITNYRDYDLFCKAIGYTEEEMREKTQLDWIKDCSRYQVFFYDEEQTVKGSDITAEQFYGSVNDTNYAVLHTQMRCLGGEPFIDYVKRILDRTQVGKEKMSGDFEFLLFDHIGDMVNLINSHDKKDGLSCLVAGYSWEWVTKKDNRKQNNDLWDFEIEGHRFIWNINNRGWILSDRKPNEVGCVHTTQGYDLNYVGVIFGREIDYDKESKRIVIDPSLFFDRNVKNSSTDEELKRFIINSYSVMMTRGIKGCYVYACNKNLREYLSDYISKWNSTE